MSVSAFADEYNLNSFGGYYQLPSTGAINFSAGNFPLSLTDSKNYTVSGSKAYIYWQLNANSLPKDITYYCKLYFPVSSSTRGVNYFEVKLDAGNAVHYTTFTYDYASNVLTFNEFGSLTEQYAFRDFSYAPIYSGDTIVGVSFSGIKNWSTFKPVLRTYFYYQTGSNSFESAFQSYDDFIISTEPIVDEPVYNPTITATTSNVTDTTVDLAIDVTGMNLAKTYNIRIDGTTADGEELSQVIGTITGEETYSTSATLGPFTPNTTYRATLVLLENGVDISSDLIEYTTLPPTYDPQISASQFAVTSTTMTSQVTLSGLDPFKQYRPYYRLSLADDDTIISQGYALDIMPVTGIGEYTAYSRINNLTANTEYRIIWALLEDGMEYVDAFDYFNFTTLDDGSGGSGSGSSDDNSGILLMILNKVSAILDTMNGGNSEGILASINEKLGALIDTLANPEEKQLENNFKGSLTEVNNNFFGDTAKGQAVTVSDVGNLADTQSTVKTIFQSDYTVTDFFGLFSDNSFFGWFSAETAMDLNPLAYGSPSVADLDDPYNMQAYYENLEKVRGKK